MKQLFTLIMFFLPFFAQSQAPELIFQKGHTAPITSISTNESGSFVATSSFDGTAILWDIATGKTLKVFDSGSMGETKVVLHATLPYLALSSSSGQVTVFNYALKTVIFTQSFSDYSPSALVFQSIDNQLLIGFSNGRIQAYDLSKKQLIYEVIAGDALVTALDINKNGNDFLVSTETGFLGLFDEKTGAETLQIQTSGSRINTAQFSFDGQYIICGSDDGVVKFYQTASGRYFNAFEGHENPVLSAQLSRDNSTVISADLGGIIRVWNGQTGDTIRTIETPPYSLRATLLHPDGRTVLGGIRQILRLWRAETGRKITDFKGIAATGDAKYINAVRFSADGSQIISAGGDGRLRFWGEISGDKIETQNSVSALAIHPDNRLMATGGKSGTITLWDQVTKDTIRSFNAHQKNITQLQFIQNGHFLISSSADKTLKIWQTNRGQLLHTITGHTSVIMSFAIDPSENFLAVSDGNGQVKLWNLTSFELIGEFPTAKHTFFSLAFAKNQPLLYGGSDTDTLYSWDLLNFQIDKKKKVHEGAITALITDNERIITGGFDKKIKVWSSQLDLLHAFSGHSEGIATMTLSSPLQLLVSASSDNSIRLWDVKNYKPLATFYGFEENWAVLHPSGLFDASEAAMKAMHYVLGLEPLELTQLKERYFEPGLTGKILQTSAEPLRDVLQFATVPLYPTADLNWSTSDLLTLNINLQKRNGGIGKVSLFLNKKELIEDINPRRQNNISVQLSDYQHFLKNNEDDFFAIKTYNEEGWLSSRPVRIRYVPPKQTKGDGKITLNPNRTPQPKFYALVVGTSDYRGEQLDLSYADKDAADMARALNAVAKNLFETVQIELLTTSEGKTPSKNQLIKSFQDIAREASPDDIFVLYLSGHGVTYGENDPQFYYLTKDITSENLTDTEIRRNFALSSHELTNLLKSIPAQKQVMIIDACSSGSLVNDVLSKSRSLSSSQRRALDRMKDRTGMFILAGSAANKVSYEASQFGQGLLTYSLLLGMNGSALRENEYVDVMQLFQFAADKVPEFAAFIGGMQRPVIATPTGSNSFDIGQVDPSIELPLASVKPIFIQSNFQEENSFADLLELGETLDRSLTNISAQGKAASIIFVNVKKYPNAYSIKGRYLIEEGQVKVKVNLFKGNTLVKSFEIDATVQQPDFIIQQILQNIE